MYQDITLKNNQGWNLLAGFRGDECYFQLSNVFGLQISDSIQVIAKIRFNDESLSAMELFQKQVCDLSKHKITFGFQVYKLGRNRLVVFEPYGLSGGAGKGKKNTGVILGILQIAIGIWCIAKVNGKGKVVGSILVNSGVNSSFYAITSFKEEFSAKKYATTTVSSWFTGLFMNCVWSLNSTKKWPGHIFNSSISSLGHTLLLALQQKKLPTISEAGSSIIGNILGGGVSKLSNQLLTEFQIATSVSSSFWRGLLAGGLSGTLSSAINTLSVNISTGKNKWGDGLYESVRIGAISSGIIQGVEGVSRFQRLEEVHLLNQEMIEAAYDEKEIVSKERELNTLELKKTILCNLISERDRRRRSNFFGDVTYIFLANEWTIKRWQKSSSSRFN